MRAIDTNVVVRYLLRDDHEQADIAEQIVQKDCYLSLTVLLECVWLLSSRYALPRASIAAALIELVSLSSISTVDDDLVLWAIGRFQLGADFADMAHLLDGRFADQFSTFDRGVAKAAGKGAPMTIETLI